MLEINKIHLGDNNELIKQISDKSIDCIYVDVPYLHDTGGEGKDEISKRTAKRKSELSEISKGFDINIFYEFIRISKKLNLFVWCSRLQINAIMNFFIEKGYLFDLLVWHKTNVLPCANNYFMSDLEYCLYFRETGVSLNNDCSLKSKFYESATNKKDKVSFHHPTIKPLELVKRHLQHTTQENDTVLDCFIGSGTTAVACKELNRNFIGIEINPKWHKVACDRLNNIDANGQIGFLLK